MPLPPLLLLPTPPLKLLAVTTNPASSRAPQIYPPGPMHPMVATNSCRDTPSGTASERTRAEVLVVVA
jgi:hypothetical protein